MIAIKARFDGEKIVLPEELRGSPPQHVVLVFEEAPVPFGSDEHELLVHAQESTFKKVWDNEEDAVYDSL